MRRAEPTPRRDNGAAAAARWHASVRRGYLRLAERGATDYLLIPYRLHWKAWSAYR